MNAVSPFREAFSGLLLILQGSSFCIYFVDKAVDVLKAHITQPVMSLPAREIRNSSGVTSFLSAKVHNQQDS